MSNFLDEITLGLSPQDLLEDMEVEVLATQEDHLVLDSPNDQALRDLAVNRWPSQGPTEDRLLGPSQLAAVLSDQSSSADKNDNAGVEGLLKGFDEAEEEEQEEVVEILQQEDEPMTPATGPSSGSQPLSHPTPAPSWSDQVEEEERTGLESLQTSGALLAEWRQLR